MSIELIHVPVVSFLTRYWSYCENIKTQETLKRFEDLVTEDAASLARRYPAFASEIWTCVDAIEGRAEGIFDSARKDIKNDRE